VIAALEALLPFAVILTLIITIGTAVVGINDWLTDRARELRRQELSRCNWNKQ